MIEPGPARLRRNTVPFSYKRPVYDQISARFLKTARLIKINPLINHPFKFNPFNEISARLFPFEKTGSDFIVPVPEMRKHAQISSFRCPF
jgi:hypothetical protein